MLNKEQDFRRTYVLLEFGRHRGRSRGRRVHFSKGKGWWVGWNHESNSTLRQANGNTRGTFGRRGIFHDEHDRKIRLVTCNYYGKISHREEECRKKWKESASPSREVPNYATNSEFKDYEGMFIMRHKVNTMSASGSTNTSTSEEVWFIDSGASNDMASNAKWFSDLRTPNRLGYVETRDDTTHTIRHIGNVPLSMANNNCIRNVLHIPTITKNLVSVSLIVEQGM